MGHTTDVGPVTIQFPSDPAVHAAVKRVANDFSSRGMFSVSIGDSHGNCYMADAILSQGKILSFARRLQKPDWALSIQAFREKHGMKQEDLARRLDVTQAAISKWESGQREPTPDIWLKFARLTQGVERRQFLQRAGITQEDLDSWSSTPAPVWRPPAVSIEVEPAQGATPHGKLKKRPEFVLIPLLHDAAAAGSPRMIQEADIDEHLVARSKRTPHPEHTLAIKVTGDSMSPTLEDGYIIAIDTKQTDYRELFDEMVAARAPDGGVTIKWLRDVEGEPMLIAQHTSPRFPPIMLARQHGWKIIGKVLWWIGQPK